MSGQFWNNTFLDDHEYYQRVLSDGNIIRRKDVEMADLRYFTSKYADEPGPIIQVYKANRYGDEVILTFRNYKDATEAFFSLLRGEKLCKQ